VTRYGDITRLINALRSPHGSIELHGTIYFPCAMALRLMPRSPWRRIRLASIAGELTADRTRLGSVNLRQLDTSHGCQDHTVLPYASAPYVLRGYRSLTEEPALRTLFAPDAAASTTSRLAFVTIAIRPSCRRDGRRIECTIAVISDRI
jgi:hypothetical protein